MGLETIDTSNAQLAFQITGGKADQFLVLRYRGTEGLSQLYRFEIQLASSEEAVEFDKIVGKAAVLSINTEFGPRFFHGVISRFEMTGEDPAFTHFRAELVPAIWLLTHRYYSRMFQDTSAKDIITKVLNDAGIASDRFDMSQLKRTYDPREYCVQYRETDYNFICRLMEEEGIRWWFEHSKEASKLMMADAHSYVPIEGDFKLPYRSPSGLIADEEHVFGFRLSQAFRLGTVTLQDFDFKKPGLNLECQADRGEEKKLEFSDFPGEYTTQSHGVDIAQLRIEEFEAGRIRAIGQSTCTRILAGRKFELTEHPSVPANNAYLITRVTHEGKESITLSSTGPSSTNGRADRGANRASPGWVYHAGQVSRDIPAVAQASGAGPLEALTVPNLLDDPRPPDENDDDEAFGLYECRFECIPATVSYRPPRITPWPVVRGTQTARVVGPEGEEIHCDKFGRVKVQFHWDREGEFNDKSSCWIRVSQGMAGGQYGMMFIPRIGQEVIVDFLEGNPDNPIIVGRVYNADHMPPYPLPDQKTKSVIKGNSSKGSGGCNEIRFEDLTDKEQLFIQAQKQMDTHVKASHFHTTGGSYHLHVGGEKEGGDLFGELRELVYKATHVHNVGEVRTWTEMDESHAVDGNLAHDVGGNVTHSIGGDLVEKVQTNKVVEVTQTATFKALSVKLEASTGMELKCGGSSIVLTPAAIFINAPIVNINSGSGPPVAPPMANEAKLELPEDAAGADSSKPGKDVKYDKNGYLPGGTGPGDVPGTVPDKPVKKEKKPDPTIEAKWSKSEVTPDHNSAWHPATPPTDTVPEEAKVQMLVTTTNVPDGTAAYITINHCHTKAMIREGSLRDLVVIGNKVVHKDTKAVPEWVFQQKHLPWDPWDKPFFYFRVTVAYKGLRDETPSDYEKREPECLRVIYWHACVGDAVADTPAGGGLTTVAEMNEIAGILRAVKKTKVLAQAFNEASAVPVSLWGSVLRNVYCYHHASHGAIADRTTGALTKSPPPNPPPGPVGNNRSILGFSVSGGGFTAMGDAEVSQKNNVPSTPRYLAYIDTCVAGWEPSFANAIIRRGTQNVIAFRKYIPDGAARQMARDFHNKWTKNHKCDPDKIPSVFFDVGAAHYGSMRPVLFGKGGGAIKSPAAKAASAVGKAIKGAVSSIKSLFKK